MGYSPAMDGRLRGATTRIAVASLVVVGLGYGMMHAACNDYIEAAVPEEAGRPVLEDVSNPPLPRPEAGGEPPRRDGALAPADAAQLDAGDARSDG